VLVTGLSIDDETMRAVTYKIEDPWPLDSNNQWIADPANHAVEKVLPAADLEGTAMACFVPFVITNQSHDRMQHLLNDLRKLEQNPQTFSFDDLDRLAGTRSQTFDSPQDALNSSGAASDDSLTSDPDALNDLNIDGSGIDWSTDPANPVVHINIKYENDNDNKDIDVMAYVEMGEVPAGTGNNDYTGWNVDSKRTVHLHIPANQTKSVNLTMHWQSSNGSIPRVRFYYGHDYDKSLISAHYAQ
jgi:hypothetical protein